MGRLLVSVRGPDEAEPAALGGAHIADVEFPGSALGTPYPLNIKGVRSRLNEAGFEGFPISTNIGEDQYGRANACQAALGIAVAGADYVKCGLAGLGLDAAAYLGRNIVRSVKEWCPDRGVFIATFPEEEFRQILDPIKDGAQLLEKTGADGLLIDTFHKNIGKGLLDYLTLADLSAWAAKLHDAGREAWVAGSVTLEQLPSLWATSADVICIRGAACETDDADSLRFGTVTAERVSTLAETVPA